MFDGIADYAAEAGNALADAIYEEEEEDYEGE